MFLSGWKKSHCTYIKSSQKSDKTWAKTIARKFAIQNKHTKRAKCSCKTSSNLNVEPCITINDITAGNGISLKACMFLMWLYLFKKIIYAIVSWLVNNNLELTCK